jgi:tetratricopeptide (TPR) repeat protein
MRGLLLVALLNQAAAGAAIAQSYSTAPPQPQTTSVPALRAVAVRREIEERFTIGLDAAAHNDWNAARAEFERIIVLHPSEPQGSTAHYDLALADANLHRNDDAASELRAALSLDPAFLAALANLVSIDLVRGDLREARVIADRYLRLAPESARGLYSRGIVAMKSGDYATARDDFGKRLHQNPSYALAHYDLALAEERLGRYPAAERELRSALVLAPTYARARFALGVVLLREGEHAEARSAFARATIDAAGDPALANIAAAMRDSIKN